jgi:hypothetical protein
MSFPVLYSFTMAIICSSQSAKARGKRAMITPPPYIRVKVMKNVTRKTMVSFSLLTRLGLVL